MNRILFVAVLFACLATAAVSSIVVFQAFPPPDLTASVIVAGWLGGPFLIAMIIAGWFRRRVAVLGSLLAAVLLSGGVGVWLYHSVGESAVLARQSAATAVLPGEDPDRGPGGMRKAGAEMHSFISDVFGIGVIAVVPPVQAAVVLFTAVLAYCLGVWQSRQDETEWTDRAAV